MQKCRRATEQTGVMLLDETDSDGQSGKREVAMSDNVISLEDRLPARLPIEIAVLEILVAAIEAARKAGASDRLIADMMTGLAAAELEGPVHPRRGPRD